MNYAHSIASQLDVRPEQVAAAIELLDSGNTLPFIARYRKEVTGGLDEEQLRQAGALLQKMRSLDERRAVVLKSIEEQGKLTAELQSQIESAGTLTALEDLYAPFRPKRRTRASVAREQGLQPLADLIVQQPAGRASLAELARPYLNEAVLTLDDAWAGARDIVAEAISDHAAVRRLTREKAFQWGVLHCQKVAEDESAGMADDRQVYALYYEFEAGIGRLRPHQVLAVNRGEAEKVLRVKVLVAERDWRTAIQSAFRPDPRSPLAAQLEAAILDAAERLLLPAIERDVRRALTEQAEAHAIAVFAANLRALLSQPPLAGHTVLGIDPGFRTGCKVAVIDPTGRLLATATIYPHEPQRQSEQALRSLAGLVDKYHVTLIAIGNGTASRETEALVAALIRERSGGSPHDIAGETGAPAGSGGRERSQVPGEAEAGSQFAGLQYLIVSEAGASVYSASPLARQELPELDVSLRGAVSIARRVQDPLAELVKIDPRSIGVGLYQHDVDQKQLSAGLTDVVESVVNQVGVEVSTASPALLTYVAGIGPALAEKIVAYRDENGPFLRRADLHKVPGLGARAFEQAAGFLRIRDGVDPLDASAIHPESYPIAQVVLERAGISTRTLPVDRKPALDALLQVRPVELLAADLGAGVPTLADILEQLVRPGRDPRQDAPLPILRSDVLSMEDLHPGMTLKGTVRNVVDFGAFVDIGVKQDGLLHRSQIPPGTRLQVGEVIDVVIQRVEAERGRIGLGWRSGP